MSSEAPTTVTIDGGTTISVEQRGTTQLLILDNPDAPDGMRNLESGRIIHGGFQPAPFGVPFALRPATLRAIADLIEAQKQ